jgi:HPr kinase/phosphorylase
MPLTVGTLVERLREPLRLELFGAAEGLAREISAGEAQSPGLLLAGWTGRFLDHRIQVLGETEISYLRSRPDADRRETLARLFAYPIPCVFVTKGQELPDEMHELAQAAGVAVLRSQLRTAEFYKQLNPYLENEFAPATNMHGSLADVFGVGLLFTGASGIGKSECVLDLVERGHRLVADDLVLIKRRGTDVLLGRGHELQRHFMEIRGVGLIDVPAIFGIHAVRQQKRVEVIVRLEPWDANAAVERTGLDETTTTVLDVEVPYIKVRLNPGKNITVIAEVIAMNHLLKYSGGGNAAQQFNERLIGRMRRAADVNRYLQEDDE